jgi:hypothetical protein
LNWDLDQTKDLFLSATLKCIKSNEADLLSLFKLYSGQGYLHDPDQHLLMYLQDVVISRFEFLDKETVLEYAQFFNDIGIWYWDTELITKIRKQF